MVTAYFFKMKIPSSLIDKLDEVIQNGVIYNTVLNSDFEPQAEPIEDQYQALFIKLIQIMSVNSTGVRTLFIFN